MHNIIHMQAVVLICFHTMLSKCGMVRLPPLHENCQYLGQEMFSIKKNNIFLSGSLMSSVGNSSYMTILAMFINHKSDKLLPQIDYKEQQLSVTFGENDFHTCSVKLVTDTTTPPKKGHLCNCQQYGWSSMHHTREEEKRNWVNGKLGLFLFKATYISTLSW